VVGAALSAGFLTYQHRQRDKAARRSAFTALAVEFLHVVIVGSEPKVLAFSPMPDTAYRQALLHITTVSALSQQKVTDAGLTISAYNASAAFFNTHTALDDTWEGRVAFLARKARDQAYEARDQLVSELDLPE